MPLGAKDLTSCILGTGHQVYCVLESHIWTTVMLLLTRCIGGGLISRLEYRTQSADALEVRVGDPDIETGDFVAHKINELHFL